MTKILSTNDRREAILKQIRNSKKPISASTLAKKYGVSRQIVVGDVALLRASQHPIAASPKGYIFEGINIPNEYVVACQHDRDHTREELDIIVDCGGKVKNVIVSHPVYGELIGKLDIESRLDVDEFLDKCNKTKAKNLSEISDGVHLHTIICKNEQVFKVIQEKLKDAGFLYK